MQLHTSQTLRSWTFGLVACFVAACGNDTQNAERQTADQAIEYDIILQGGTVYDGSGDEPYVADVAIVDDRIAGIGDYGSVNARDIFDVSGYAVAPGFINMLSWATTSLIGDGRSMSDIKQGVTLEVMGEGYSMGPLTEEMKQEIVAGDPVIDEIPWTSLGEYLEFLEEKGVSPNVASFLGAETVRVTILGYLDVNPTPEQLAEMQEIVRAAMGEGALGVSSALIYAPATFAEIDELVALASAAGDSGGMYISHMRSEADRLEEAVQEVIDIAKRANVRAEIYHLKAAGQHNWHKLEKVMAQVNEARKDGYEITADMYPYIAGSAGLDAAVPRWVQEGRLSEWVPKLAEPEIRAQLLEDMHVIGGEWENLYMAARPEGIRLVGLVSDDLKSLNGKTIAEAAELRDQDPREVVLDLLVEDKSWVPVVYTMMSEENIAKKLAVEWVSVGSDGMSWSVDDVPEGATTHPRSFGSFARILGKYVRDEGVISLQEAIRRMTSMPAATLRIRDRGSLKEGYFADVAIFDPETIADRATFDEPFQYSVGMVHVFVNGEQVLADGEHTGALPGRVVRGPGWTGWQE